MGDRPLAAPIIGMASTTDGGGYWEVATDGGIFALGDAQYFGSLGGQGYTGIAGVPPNTRIGRLDRKGTPPSPVWTSSGYSPRQPRLIAAAG